MDKVLPVARSVLILGGQKSGKSRRAEVLAQSWLAQSGSHRAVLVATAQAWDDEMTQRIARHQADRAQRVPGLTTVEEPRHLAQAIQRHSTPDTLIVVDCLTLWLTNWLMPVHGNAAVTEQTLSIETGQLLQSISSAPGPLVLVGNEIGLGVIPLGREVRAFVDALGLLNQQVAAACARVTLMAAGLPLTLKDVS
jgi:adenosylcobinamide kinase/adenosylcobinamide-phosphate guanylyltransferase